MVCSSIKRLMTQRRPLATPLQQRNISPVGRASCAPSPCRGEPGAVRPRPGKWMPSLSLCRWRVPRGKLTRHCAGEAYASDVATGTALCEGREHGLMERAQQRMSLREPPTVTICYDTSTGAPDAANVPYLRDRGRDWSGAPAGVFSEAEYDRTPAVCQDAQTRLVPNTPSCSTDSSTTQEEDHGCVRN